MEASGNGTKELLANPADSFQREESSLWKDRIAGSPIVGAACVCMDYRFCFRQRDALRECLGIGNGLLDLLAIPGGPYGLVRPKTDDPKRLKFWESAQVVAFEGIDIAIAKHSIRELALCDHEKCGMCAKDGHVFRPGYESFLAEKEFHYGRLREAKKEVLTVFPSLDIKLCFSYFNRAGKVQIDVVH